MALINENAKVPIVKFMDYGKFLYNQEKQIAKQKAKAHGPELKEVRFSIKIDQHDLEFKINRVKKFISRGDKVKVSVQLKGREMMFQDRVRSLIQKIKEESGGELEKPIERMGSRFFATIVKSQIKKQDKNEIKNK